MSGFGTTPYGASAFGDAGDGISASGIDLASAGQLSSGMPEALAIPGLLSGGMLAVEIGDRYYFNVIEALTLDAVTAGETLPNLFAAISNGDAIEHSIVMAGNLADGMTASERIAIAWRMLIESGAEAEGTPELAVRHVLAIIDAMVATGAAEGRLSALVDVATAMTLQDLVMRGVNLDALGEAGLAAEVASTVQVLADLLDSISCLGDAMPGMRLTAVVSAAGAADDTIEGLLRAVGDLNATAIVYGTFRLGDDEYSGWVMNAPLRAFTTNTNMAFDSFATFKGLHLAAGPAGIVRFTGRDAADTAGGEPVNAALRTAVMDFGTTRFKRMPDVFFGLSTDGRMFLKVMTRDDKTGARYEDWYELQRTKAGPGTARAELGRGLRSTWWQFELCNIAGAGIELDAIELRPMILDKRT